MNLKNVLGPFDAGGAGATHFICNVLRAISKCRDPTAVSWIEQTLNDPSIFAPCQP